MLVVIDWTVLFLGNFDSKNNVIAVDRKDWLTFQSWTNALYQSLNTQDEVISRFVIGSFNQYKLPTVVDTYEQSTAA